MHSNAAQPVRRPPELYACQAVEQLLLVGMQQLGQHTQQALHHR
jgi:hypothetical protein